MENIKINIVEKTKSTYDVHLLNTDTHYNFDLPFDLAELQERQNLLDSISYGDVNINCFNPKNH